MASLIRSNTAFANGDLTLVEHSISVAEDGLVSVSANFACLGTKQVIANNLRNFQPDQGFPVALPADLASMPLETSMVYLDTYTSNVQNGICYITGNYVGSSTAQKYRVTRNYYTRSFDGFVRTFSEGNITALTTLSFEYDATEDRVVWTYINERKLSVTLKPKIDVIRNVKIGVSGGNSLNFYPDPRSVSQKITTNSSRDKVGIVTRVTTSAIAEYIQEDTNTLSGVAFGSI